MSYSTLTIVALTLLSTTMLLAIVVTKMLRDEKRRSDARVAMLAAMAAEAAAYAPPEEQEDDYEGAHENAAFQAEADELPLAYEYTPTIATDMFTARAEPSAWPKRLAVAGALAGVGFAIVIGAKSGAFNRDVSPAAAPAAAQPAASAAPQTQLPLDLLSLKQSQEAKTLTITGLVQNPRAGAELSNVAATAFVFGADGSFLASGRAPLDFTVLRPGDESGFVITVPVTSPVARYRVGFRGEDGHVIGHVDRRSSGTIARGPS
jgi:hypothetical protein